MKISRHHAALDRNLPIEARVERLPRLSHSPRADRLQDLVGTEPGPRSLGSRALGQAAIDGASSTGNTFLMRVTSKGQVTIPIDIRERLGIRAETEVEFELVGGEVRLRVVGGRNSDGRNVVEAMRGKATAGLSTDEILGETRGSE